VLVGIDGGRAAVVGVAFGRDVDAAVARGLDAFEVFEGAVAAAGVDVHDVQRCAGRFGRVEDLVEIGEVTGVGANVHVSRCAGARGRGESRSEFFGIDPGRI